MVWAQARQSMGKAIDSHWKTPGFAVSVVL
jgi:hypothetical protein